MDTARYSWEPYTVETDDGWTLSMFRITAKIDKDNKKTTTPDEGKFPVIVWHGGTMDALSWVSSRKMSEDEVPVFEHEVMPLQLVDNGYDVFMMNARGTKYSNKNNKDGT